MPEIQPTSEHKEELQSLIEHGQGASPNCAPNGSCCEGWLLFDSWVDIIQSGDPIRASKLAAKTLKWLAGIQALRGLFSTAVETNLFNVEFRCNNAAQGICTETWPDYGIAISGHLVKLLQDKECAPFGEHN